MYLITWITTHLPTSEGRMAELAKARSMQPYIILYKTTLQLGVRNLPITRQRTGGQSNRVSVIHKSDALPVSHRATLISHRATLWYCCVVVVTSLWWALNRVKVVTCQLVRPFLSLRVFPHPEMHKCSFPTSCCTWCGSDSWCSSAWDGSWHPENWYPATVIITNTHTKIATHQCDYSIHKKNISDHSNLSLRFCLGSLWSPVVKPGSSWSSPKKTFFGECSECWNFTCWKSIH